MRTKIGVGASKVAATNGVATVQSSIGIGVSAMTALAMAKEGRTVATTANGAMVTMAGAVVGTAAANGVMVTRGASGATAVNTATAGEGAVAIITSYAALDTNAAAGSADTVAVAVDTAAAAATRGASIQVPLDT